MMPMNELPPLTEPAVIKLPAEIDIANADEVGFRLMSAFTWGGIVVADMTATAFCDSLGVKALLAAHRQALHVDCQLRFALPPGGQVVRVLHLVGADRVIGIYPTVAEAVASAPSCERDA
jgi:anti-anti-sigma factor